MMKIYMKAMDRKDTRERTEREKREKREKNDSYKHQLFSIRQPTSFPLSMPHNNDDEDHIQFGK